MNRAGFKKIFKGIFQEISRFSRITKMFVYAYFTIVIVTFFLYLLLILGVAFGLIQTKAHATKPDSCRQYQEMAVEELTTLTERVKALIDRFPQLNEKEIVAMTGELVQTASSKSIAYSILYQNCRDLERRKSK